jgi:GDP-L-fucose synthase
MIKTKILLTGSTGMVGRNILEHPAINKFNVLKPTSQDLNLCDFNAIQDYLRKYKPDLIIHAAGKVGGIQANMREPATFLLNNLDMGRNIIWAARQAGIKRLINIGSSCMYPRNFSEPLLEEMLLSGELEPSNEGYALAKIVTARLCEYIMHDNPNYQYKTLIPCNLFGRYDNFNPESSHLLPAIIHKIHLAKQRCEQTVEIWGDGNARREFMYAGDFADAVIRSITNFDTLPKYMNVGLGYDYSINEYYQSAADVMEYTGSFIYDLTKPIGMVRKLVNIERQKTWGWTAKNDLHKSIKNIYEFYLKELHS